MTIAKWELVDEKRKKAIMQINNRIPLSVYIATIKVILVSGEGNAPPEDVGGADGFAEFLKKLSTGKYYGKKETARWGRHYGYEVFDCKKTSQEVKRSLKWLW